MPNRPNRPEDLFRAEKERALSVRNSQHARLLAEAKAAFDKLMAEGQAARKSGRPRKHPLPPLKTSSSRPLVKPAAPPAVPPAVPAPIAKVAAPTITNLPIPVAKLTPAKPAKVVSPAKAVTPAVTPAKAVAPAKPVKTVKTVKTVKAKRVSKTAAKPKPKSKRPTKR